MTSFPILNRHSRQRQELGLESALSKPPNSSTHQEHIMTKSTTYRFNRRTLLKGAAAAGLVASGAGVASNVFAPAVAQAAQKVRIAWTEVAACHSPLGFGVASGIYAKHGLDVDLFYQGASGQT